MKGYQFSLKLWVLKYLIRSEPPGDFINSEEYREPDWLVKMKELKKKLAGKFGSSKEAKCPLKDPYVSLKLPPNCQNLDPWEEPPW